MLIDSLNCDIMIHVGYMHNISAGSGYMHVSRKLFSLETTVDRP